MNDERKTSVIPVRMVIPVGWGGETLSATWTSTHKVAIPDPDTIASKYQTSV
jgi:uncharacterized protein YbdZ (MbtH family)